MKKKILIPLVCALFAFASTSHVVVAEEIQNKFISDDFVEGLHRITPAYFFNDPIEPYERFKKANLPFEGIDRASKAQEHYLKLSDELCSPLASEMEDLLDDAIEGQDNIFGFNEELTKVMRDAGAYALPLRLEKAEIGARLWKKSWAPNTDPNVTRKEFSEYIKSKGYNWMLASDASGAVLVGGHSVRAIRPSTVLGYNEILQNNEYDITNFRQGYDFTQTYLFVLLQAQEDVNSDAVYMFVEVPFKVSSRKFGSVENLTKSLVAEAYPGELRCYVASKSGLSATAKSKNKRLQEQKKWDGKERFVSVLDVMPPPTLPANEHYLDKNASYNIESSEVTQPYLRCWLSAFNLVEGVSEGCLNSGYADEYKNIVNADVCGGENTTKIDRKFTYPYHYTKVPYDGIPIYRGGYTDYYATPMSCDDYKTSVSKWSR